MNKLRLIKIYELRGKVHPIEATIIKVLDGIEEVKFGKYIEYKKDGMDYFSYYRNSNNICLYSVFYNFIDKFGCSAEETKDIFAYLLEKHLKITINDVY